MRQDFVVDRWVATDNELHLNYAAGKHRFTETLRFPTDIVLTPFLTRAIDLLAVVAGVSYLKAFVPARLDIREFPMTTASLDVIHGICDDGLREFAFTNHLQIPVDVAIESSEISDLPEESASHPTRRKRPLLPLGGGKDSCVVLSALRHRDPVLLSVGDNPYTANVARAAGLPLNVVGRHIDPLLLEMNAAGAPNGHVPVTAINSLISVVMAELLHCSDVVMANESSSSEPTRIVNGLAINHQYSKSFHFETLLRAALSSIGSPINYFSALRNRDDEEISRAFARTGPALHGSFMSCNRAMVRDPEKRSNGWCTQCAKCRTVYLSLAPHMTPQQLANIFRTDLLNDSSQIEGFRALLTQDEKPFECVADIAHASSTMAFLGSHPMWKDHVVVKALCAMQVVRSTWDSSGSTSNINIPVEYLDDLERVFGG